MDRTESVPAPSGAAAAKQVGSSGFVRKIGLLPATAINMTQMCGIGPFITIPLMVAAFGGPQAIIGWVAGAILALADGLVWAELGAAMPGAGGTYLYLREAFQYWTGKLTPFLFVWTAILAIPLIMSTGVIGLVQYLGYLVPNMSWWQVHAISLVVTALVVFLLYRRIETVGVISQVFLVVMLLSVLSVIAAGFSGFKPSLAFAFPADAFTPNARFFVGLGAGLLIAVYDYLGYNTTAYMGDEIRDPGRVIPRSVVYSVIGIMCVYLLMQVAVLGVVPSDEIAKSTSVASLVLERTWGRGAAQVVTVLILVTAFASVYAGLLGGSRVPYNAARDGLFLRQFGRLHPRLRFPHVGLLVMGGIVAIASFFDLTTVLPIIFAVFVTAWVAQVVALTILRRKQPGLRRPYRMWLYPVPSAVAVIGWLYVYYSAGLWPAIVVSLIWLAAGVVAFLVFARVEGIWPFGPIEVEEAYLRPPATASSE